MPGIVIVNQHEPQHEVSGRLLEIAQDKGYNPAVVEAQRGEHDANLSFRVPQDVADEFEKDRADRWPTPEQTGDGETASDGTTTPVRKSRPGKAQQQ